MLEPNSRIQVTFNAPNTFTYQLVSSAPWTVSPDGAIQSPPRSRLIEFELATMGVEIWGFQVSVRDPAHNPLPDQDWAFNDTDGQAVLCEANARIVKLRTSTQHEDLFYRLAVKTENGEVIWDDPKIYNKPVE